MAKNPLNASKILFDPQENQKAFDDYAKHLQGLENNATATFNALTVTMKKSNTAIKAQNKSLLALAETFKSLAGQTEAYEARNKQIREQTLILQALKKIEKETNIEREAAKKAQKELSAINKEYNKNLAVLNKTNQKLEKQVASITKKYEAQTKSQKAADNSLEKLKLEAKEAEKTFKSLEGSVDSTSTEITEAKENFLRLKSQLNESNQSLRDQVKAIDLANDSYLSWQAVVTKASRELKKLEDPLGKNKAKADALRKSINENKDKLKEFDSSIGNFQRNVGNYESALGDLEGAFNGLPSAVSGSAGALIEFGKNLKGNKIAAATTALAGLGAAFSQTKEGGEDIQKTLAGVESAFDTTVGAIGGAVVNLKNWITASGDIEKADALDKLTNSFTGFAGVVSSNITKATELKAEFIDLEKASRLIEVSLAKLSVQFELQNAIADDATKSFKEREEANLKALDTSEQIAIKEIELAKSQLGIIDAQLKAKQDAGLKDKELLDQQLEANKQLIEAEGRYTLTLRENEKQRTELKQDRLEKDLDILIDGFDNQKTINERIISSDKTVFANRQKLLNDTRILADESFKGQKEAIGQLTDKPVNIDDLLNLDATELNETIRGLEVSEIIEGRILEVVRERRLVLQDLKEGQDDLNEAAFERVELETNIALKSVLLTKLTLKEREELIDKFNKDVEDKAIQRLQNEIAARKKRNEDTLALESELADALFTQKETQLEKEQEAAEKTEEINKQKIDDEITLINLNEQRAKNLNSFLQKNIKDEDTLKALKFAQFLIEQRAAKLRERARSKGSGQVAATSGTFDFLSNLPAFAKGVIDFRGEGTETSDSNIVRIANRESVMTGEATRNSKGLLTGIQAGQITDMHLQALESKEPKMLSLERKVVVQEVKQEIDYDKLAKKMGIEVAKNIPKTDLLRQAGNIILSEQARNHNRQVYINSKALKYKGK